jgi:hypothetical protein
LCFCQISQWLKEGELSTPVCGSLLATHMLGNKNTPCLCAGTNAVTSGILQDAKW